MLMSAFPFRPWVRSTCAKGMIWGIGVVALFGGVGWTFRTPGSSHVGRAFAVLVFYALLFQLSLLKIWWTAGKPAVTLDARGLSYSRLHALRPRRIEYAAILRTAPRPGTESHGIIFESRPGRAKEFFLNLAVIKGRHRFLDELAVHLQREGLEPIPGARDSWERPNLQLEL